MGDPISHSLSPAIHQLFAKQTGRSLSYTTLLVEKKHLKQAISDFQASGGTGLNFTAPLKETAFQCVDHLSPLATLSQAVNTLFFKEDGHWVGENTDGRGFLEDVMINLGGSFRGKNVLILGSGGAVKGLLPIILTQNPKHITIANRTPDKALMLANHCITKQNQHLFIPETSIQGSSLTELAGSFDWIIHGLGQDVDITPFLSGVLLNPNTWCYDLAYGKKGSPFLRWAKENQATHVFDGLGLLVEQAALSFEIWHGIKPNTAVVIETLAYQRSLVGA